MTPALAEPNQRTLGGVASVSGSGLFSGEPVTVTIKPADAEEGFVFVRTDLAGAPTVPARVEHVVPSPRRTTLKRGEAIAETVEHCLSALAGLGIDNAIIELSAREAPAGDGSASPFVEAIQRVGLVEQDSPRRPVIVTEPITVREGDAMVAALPNGGPGMDLMYDLNYGEDAPIGRQTHAFTLDPASYVDRIAPARTYAMFEEAQLMRANGMFAHLSPSDMLVIGQAGPIDNSFRFDDEPARHKLLDLLGDLTLVGRPVNARVIASKSGHALNHELARRILALAQIHDATEMVTRAEPAMDTKQVLRLLPHRYPMVLVDRVLEIEGDRRAIGVKNVSVNEPFFQGHYPGLPIMPGVLIVEAMSQLAGLMLSQKLERTGKVAVLLSLDKVKLRKSVTPGDQLVLQAEAVRATNRFGDVCCRAFVSGQLVAEAQIKFMMVDAEQD